jgi:hypothetical protein
MENDVGSRVFVPQPVPPPPADLKPPAPLQGKQEEQRLQVLSHFSDENYKLPDVDKDPSLMEAEKFWLVISYPGPQQGTFRLLTTAP